LAQRGTKPEWQLFDLPVDGGELTNVAEQHASIVSELAASFEQWWNASVPMMINETAVGPKLNPYHELFWKQFGGGPVPRSMR
jgi:arylsulfatase